MRSTIDGIRKTLDSVRNGNSRATLARAAEAYDEFILELDAIPDDAWRVIIEIFTDAALLKLPGLERFLMEIDVDLPKYSADQLRELLGILQTNVSNMDNEIARHATGDFIARAYPIEVAMKAFERLAGGIPREKHAAFVGLDVLLHRADSDWKPVVRKLHSQLLSSDQEWFHKR